MMRIHWLAIPCLLSSTAAFAQERCTVERPTASLQTPHVAGDPPLSDDPASAIWRSAGAAVISKDCSLQIDYPELRTQVKSFWTDTHLYLLFSCPYKELNLFLPAQGGGPRNKLWDPRRGRIFLGDDWTNIRHYREFEIAPTGDWIDLAIDLDNESYDQSWRSGWKTAAHIDKKRPRLVCRRAHPVERRQHHARPGRHQVARQPVSHRRLGRRSHSGTSSAGSPLASSTAIPITSPKISARWYSPVVRILWRPAAKDSKSVAVDATARMAWAANARPPSAAAIATAWPQKKPCAI